MVSQHYRNKRYKREKFIEKYLGGDGNLVDVFIVDKGHTMGEEIHELRDNGIIIIYNKNSGRLITKLIAREKQVRRYYYNSGREPPLWLLDLCKMHQDLGYNEL